MNRLQLKKVITDYRLEEAELHHILYQLQVKKRSLNSRLKLVKRKILILENKLNETPDEENNINFSCDDFDDLDLYV